MTPQQYCDANSPQRGSSRYYSLLHIAPAQRNALSILDALVSELEKVIFSSSEALVVHGKLDWWESEISRCFSGDPQHPITQALQPATQKWNLPDSYFLEILDGIRMDLDGSCCTSGQELDLYLYRTGSIPALLSAEVLGYEKRETLEIIEQLGARLRHSKRLRHLHKLVSQGLLPFSHEALEKAEIDFEEVRRDHTSPRLKSLLCTEFASVARSISTLLTTIPSSDLRNQQPHVILGKIELALIIEVENDNCSIMEHKLELTPIRKLWISWKSQTLMRASQWRMRK